MGDLDRVFYNIGFVVAVVLLIVILVVIAIGIISLMFSLWCNLYRMLSLDCIVFNLDKEVNAGKFGNYIRKEYNLSKVKRGVVRLTNKSEEEREEIRAIEERNNELRRKYSKGGLEK